MIDESIFKITPNPRYYYVTPNAQAAIDKTNYVINTNQGLTTIIGDVGCGKTSLLRLLFNEYDDNPNYTAGLMVNPDQTTATAFLKAVCAELKVPTRRSRLETEFELRNFLTAEMIAGRNTVLFIDEAQKLRGVMFEQIRQLLNYETDDHKMITMVLAGQVEIRQKLADKSKRALVSRIIAPSSLDAITFEDAQNLIDFRCHIGQIENPFEFEAIEAIYKYSSIPREIIKVCGLAVHIANLNDRRQISAEIIQMALKDSIKPAELGETNNRRKSKAKR